MATFCLIIDTLSIYVMNVSSNTPLTRESKPLEVPFLPTDDPRFLWLKYQILQDFEVWLKTIEVRPGIYERPEKQKMFCIITNL